MITVPCDSCRAELLSVDTATGQALVVDARPSDSGNLVIRDGWLVNVLGPKQAAAARAAGARLHTNHRWTCPDTSDPLVGRS